MQYPHFLIGPSLLNCCTPISFVVNHCTKGGRQPVFDACLSQISSESLCCGALSGLSCGAWPLKEPFSSAGGHPTPFLSDRFPFCLIWSKLIVWRVSPWYLCNWSLTHWTLITSSCACVLVNLLWLLTFLWQRLGWAFCWAPVFPNWLLSWVIALVSGNLQNKQARGQAVNRPLNYAIKLTARLFGALWRVETRWLQTVRDQNVVHTFTFSLCPIIVISYDLFYWLFWSFWTFSSDIFSFCF